MNRRCHAVLFALCAWCATQLAFAQTKPVPKIERLALVIGNATYTNGPLVNPVNDASDIAKLLEDSGFKVIQRHNASLREMHLAVREFGDALARGSTGLFYFAGHGMQVRGHNYLLPVDADIAREDEVSFNALDLAAVLEKMDSARNPTNLVILDACRNNPFANKFKLAVSGLAQIDAPPGSIIAFSTAPGSVAADGAGRNGLYTKHLLEHLRQPGIKIEDGFKAVRAAVRRDSKGLQTPWESTSLEGEFYFRAPLPAGAPKPVAASKSPTPKRAIALGAAPQFAVGDSWTYRITDHLSRGERVNSMHVTEIKNDEVFFNTGVVLDYFGNTRRQPVGDRLRRFSPAAMLYVFPMAPGASYPVKFSDENGDASSDTEGTMRVVGEEVIKTALGPMNAIKVERLGTWKNRKTGSSGVSSWVFWYSAHTKRPLRFEWTNKTAQGRMLNHETHELISYQVN